MDNPEDRTPYAGYTPIVPNSDEEEQLEQRVFAVLYNVKADMTPAEQQLHRDLIQDLWREFVFRESWYKTAS